MTELAESTGAPARQNVAFPSGGSTADGCLALPERAGRHRDPGVVGLTDHIADVTDRPGAEGFVAVAADLYGGNAVHEDAGGCGQGGRSRSRGAGPALAARGHPGDRRRGRLLQGRRMRAAPGRGGPAGACRGGVPRSDPRQVARLGPCGELDESIPAEHLGALRGGHPRGIRDHLGPAPLPGEPRLLPPRPPGPRHRSTTPVSGPHGALLARAARLSRSGAPVTERK